VGGFNNTDGKHIIMPEQNRDRGILTSADRSFRNGEAELRNEQSRRDARYRIRNRLSNAILDFQILLNSLDEKDSESVFENLLSQNGEEIELAPSHELIQAITFLYEGIDGQGFDFEEVLELAIVRSETRQGRIVQDIEIQINVDSETPDPNELLERLRSGEDLSDAELDILVRESDFDDLKNLIKDGIISGDIQSAEDTESGGANEE
jgi:hypothetical protein